MKLTTILSAAEQAQADFDRCLWDEEIFWSIEESRLHRLQRRAQNISAGLYRRLEALDYEKSNEAEK